MKIFASINDKGKRIKVEFPYHPDVVRLIKTVPGSKFVAEDKGGPHWTAPLDFSTAKKLRAVFGDALSISRELSDWGHKILRQAERLKHLSAADDAELSILEREAPGMFAGLRPFQRSGIAFGATADNPIIADQPGLGKTREAIGSILEAELPGPYLVVAPMASLNTVWGDHLLNVMDRDDAVFVCTGSRTRRMDSIAQAEFSIAAGEPTWVVVNPEMTRRIQLPTRNELNKMAAEVGIESKGLKRPQLIMLLGREGIQVVEHWEPDYPMIHGTDWSAIVIDECHRGAIRNPKTITAKSMYRLKAEKRIALSGTPMKNRPIDLWGTLHWLNPEVFSSKWRWADTFLHVFNNGFGAQFCDGVTDSGSACSRCQGGIKNEMMDEFNEHLTPYLLRRTKAEVFPELPPKEFIDVWCEMNPKQGKQYKKFSAEAELVIRNEKVSATNVLAELTRLKQFAISHMDLEYDDEDNFKLIPDLDNSGKRDALEMLLEERGIMENDPEEKVIVFSQFREVIEALDRWLRDKGIETLLITGKQNQRQKEEAQDLFQEEDGPSVMLMTTQAGGVSITLDRADSVIFMDETWSPADMEQASDRAHRVSRIHNVTVYTLRTKNSVDDEIMEVVRGKATTAHLIMELRRGVTTL